jgi:hypothetical protein
MRTNEGGFAPSYNAQISTDSHYGFIISTALTNDVNDHHQLAPAIKRIQATLGRTPKQLLADGDFTNNASVLAAAQAGVDFYGSWNERARDSAYVKKALAGEEFQRASFQYDNQNDVYLCPAGKILKPTRNIRHSDGTFQIVYRSPAHQCHACPWHAQCCPPSPRRGGRQITRQGVLPVVAAFHAKMSTPEAQMIYRDRGRIAEFPHAWLKDKFRLRRFHIRGLLKAGVELTWAALTFNLLALARLRRAHRNPAV